MGTLEDFFEFRKNHTDLATEVRAGVITFLTMSYIIVVNPSILSKAGMPFDGVLLATVLITAFSSLFMGLYAKLPFALAPGMGLNAFFAFTLCLGMGIRWQTALGVVFLSGLAFFILTITQIREMIVDAVPACIRYGVAGGIGLFLSLIGLSSVGFIRSNPVTTVAFGGFSANVLLFIFGLALMVSLLALRIKGTLILGVLVTSIVGLIAFKLFPDQAPLMKLPDHWFSVPSTEILFSLDIRSALTVGMLVPIFTFLFTDLFDTLSTLLGVSEVGGFIEKDGKPKNVSKALMVDAVSTIFSSLSGSSPGTTYIESASGIREGGRTGFTAVIAGLLFLPFIFFSPILSFIPAAATAPVLVIVGLFMLKPLKNIDWDRIEEAFPAFLSLILIPLCYSITQGIIWGFLSYTLLMTVKGKIREIPFMIFIIDVFALVALVLI
ncbi:MAG: NCS2 family permease [Deltaproteobacteria bacterium]|nr:NCS2 family permease [Deltaproteobacteria bacterium]